MKSYCRQDQETNTTYNKSKSTERHSSVIELFNNFESKERLSFIMFDIESFSPSISKNLFIKPIQFAKQMTVISDNGNINLIMHARKTLLLSEGIPWVKKKGNEDFDVSFGCFDGPGASKLVGSYN